jgi:hypothetical protein
MCLVTTEMHNYPTIPISRRWYSTAQYLKARHYKQSEKVDHQKKSALPLCHRSKKSKLRRKYRRDEGVVGTHLHQILKQGTSMVTILTSTNEKENIYSYLRRN